MKRVFKIAVLLILATLCTMEVQAQRRKVIYLQKYNNEPYHFGFLLGINFMDYSLFMEDNYQNTDHPKSEFSKSDKDLQGFSNEQLDHFKIFNVESYTQPGFSVGVIGDKRLGAYFNLRFCPTLSLSSKFVQYETQLYDHSGNIIQFTNETGTVKNTKTVTSHDQLATFLEFPLLVKYRSKRYNNIGAYLITGINPKLYLGSIKGTTITSGADGYPAVLQINRTDLAFEFGTGFDIYNQWFKMGIEIKMSVGLLNIVKDDAWSKNYIYNAPVKEVRNKQLQLSFTFE
ncbi:MAG: outer membrane beta-barrel protein [Bacteroidales bacterium]|nr:outer membrane beta-barrel protein [Bacteroidales bacterium]